MTTETTETTEHLSNDEVFKLIDSTFVPQRPLYFKGTWVSSEIIRRMKRKDELFWRILKVIVCSGNFCKLTQVGEPTEVDISIILQLPFIYNCLNIQSRPNGLIRLEITDTSSLFDSKKSNLRFSDEEKKSLQKFISNGCLHPQEFCSWIEGIVTEVVSELPGSDGKQIIKVNEPSPFDAEIKMSRSGPAIRLTLCVPEESEIRINLEFVIAFKINPIRSFITNVSWFEKYPGIPWLAAPIVSDDTSSDLQYSWRLDFRLHEEQIVSETYSRLRPIIDQMKMLRNTQKWTCLKNYFIDTIFLNNLEELGKDLNEQSKTSMFFKMLKTLREVCEQCKIDYFWEPSINLMEGSDPSEMMTIANRIGDIIQDIENNIKTQSFILAKYILTGDELKTLADKSRLHGHKYSGVNLQDLYKITKQDDM